MTEASPDASKANPTRTRGSIHGGIALLVAGLFAWGLGGARAEEGYVRRVFRAGDNPAVAVMVNPRGPVLAREGDSPAILLMDGYAQRQLNAPESGDFRVYESRAGQLWSVYSDGLLLQHLGEWTRHLLPEIRYELQQQPFRQLRQISLVPAEVNHVLILLSDRLVEYDAHDRRVTLIKHVSETGLERFNEMQEAADGSLWISGLRGLAHVAGPIRRISPASEWREIGLKGTGVENLQRPFDAGAGGVVVVGSTVDGGGVRSVLIWKGEKWSVRAVDSDRIRLAWPGWDGTLWGFTYNSLLRLDGARVVREAVSGIQFDVAVEPGGAFWLATSEGVARYAPPLWRAPAELQGFGAPTHAILPDPAESGGLWIASSEGLVERRDNGAVLHGWPDYFEGLFQPLDPLVGLPDGRILVGASPWPLLFDPATQSYSNPGIGPPERRVRVLGKLRGGEAAVLAWRVDASGSHTLESFDGENFTPLRQLTDVESPEDITFAQGAADGDLWVGGGSVLRRYRAGEAEPLASWGGEAPVPDRLYCMAEVGDDRVWVGGANGIYEVRGKVLRQVLGGADRVYSIARGEEGSIWAGTGGGVWRFQEGSWVLHREKEGLPLGSVLDLAKDRAGRIWAGTGGGVALYHPDADLDPPRTGVPLLLSSKTPSGDEPTSITLKGADKWRYTETADLYFSYKLDEAQWTPYSNIATVAFQTLSAGQHRLEVRAMDRNGNKDPATKLMEFGVVMPWHNDPRLVGTSMLGLVVILFFAWLAVNRHWKLVRSYAQVERMVAIRTGELERANQELLLSHKMRAIGTMAAGIAHDFNNILSIIKGSAQIIEANLSDANKIRTRVSRIQTVVEQGSGIVRSLLGVGQINPADFKPSHPHRMLEETAKLLADRIPKGVSIQVEESGGELEPVPMPEELVRRMVMNLALNAVEALTEGGEVRLRAWEGALELDGLVLHPGTPLSGAASAPAPVADRWLFLSIEDTGCGIPDADRFRIFEPFFTTKAFSTRRGTGLGLSLVYELAKGLGYGLHVRSAVGKGSAFTLIIPPAPTPPPLPA